MDFIAVAVSAFTHIPSFIISIDEGNLSSCFIFPNAQNFTAEHWILLYIHNLFSKYFLVAVTALT